ncbi:hypothetical protein RZS08_63870, partial [Arthrospira platensis SPKY1]|nr:hypothetical protein [Arthrospira platensis SPKY1]
KDQEYALKVRGGISGTQVANPGATCLTVEFSSPNSKDTQEIKVYAYTVFGPVVDIDYCPKNLAFQPITMNQ